MPRITRSSSEKENVPQATRSASETSLDRSTKYRVLLAPGSLAELTLITLPHPKNSCLVQFAVDARLDNAYELTAVDEPHRCWLVSARLEHDGRLLMLSRINPTLLILPYLMQNAREKFVEIGDCLTLLAPGKEAVEASLKVLRNASSLQAHLEKVADAKTAIDTVVYRYSEEKTLKWLSEMLAKLKELLRTQNIVHHTILNNDETLTRYAFGMLSDYIPPALATMLREHFRVKIDPVMKSNDENVEDVKKAKLIEPTTDYYVEPMTKKGASPVLSVKQQQLAKASKGTKLLRSFFSK